MPRRRRGSSRPLLTVFVIVLVLVVASLGAVYALVDPNNFKPRIAEAVHVVTGRDLTLRGPITIGFSMSPTLKATDVSLSNPPGFSGPQMATLGQVEAQLALWPLLRGRIEIVRLVLTKPDVMFETNAQGQANWQFAAQPRVAADGAPVPGMSSQSSSPPGAPRFAVSSVKIEGGRLTYRDAISGQTRAADIRQLQATSAGPMAPISATADVTVEGHDIALTAETGPLESLLTGEASAPGWPLQIVARVEGARLAVSGAMERPLQGRGYQLTLDASVPDLGPLGQFLGRRLPALRDLFGSAKVSDATGAPILSALMLRAGPSDLQEVAPGLTLNHIEISAPGLDQPMHADLDGALAGTKLRVTASLGAPAMLIPGTPANAAAGALFPVDISAEAAGATLSAKGGVTAPAMLSGLDVALIMRVPDLAALSPLAGRPLPMLRDISFDGRLSDREGGYTKGIVLKGLSVKGPVGDLSGDLTIGFQPRLSVQGQLSGTRVDLDGLQASMPVAVPAPAPAAVASASGPVPAGPRRVFSDRPINLAALDLMDLDLRLTLGEVRSGGVSYRDLAGRLVLDQGKLALDPFAATLPGGKLNVKLTADTRAADAPVVLSVNAPGIALKPLLTAFGLPNDVTGTIEVAADVTSAGRTPHALAAGLTGRVGVLMTEGEIDNRLLQATLGDVLRAARLPVDLVIGGGRTKLRCFATRLDAVHGVTTVSSLVLDTSRVLVQGGGVVNLDDEVLALRLRPLLRTGGPGVVVPVRVGGTLSTPNAAVDAGGALQGLAGGLAGNIAGLSRNPLGALSGALAGERGGDACGPAIAAARGARPK